MRPLAAVAEAAARELPSPGLAPDDPAVRESIRAIADTVVPGPAGGAHRAPGALEAGAAEEVYEPLYGISDTFPALHHDVQLATPLVLGRPARFDLALAYADRAAVFDNRVTPTGEGGQSPLFAAYAAVAIVVWFTYYGTARSTVGVEYIRFPPHSDGYFPHHTYGVRFRGMTADGNPR